jgi:peptidoglycan/LPS O-acetylase OafA/YrhL
MKKRNFGLDFVRALAISLVLFAHFAKVIEPVGFLGVEMFFALSGYLIGQILWREYNADSGWKLKRMSVFWKRRWYRTLPNYYLFLIVSLLSYASRNGFDSYESLNMGRYLWFGQDLVSRDGRFYGVSWSLSIEEWFYLVFPLILFIFNYTTRLNKKKVFIATIITFIFACGLLRIWLLYENNFTTVRGITLGRLDAIAAGVLIAYVVRNYKISRSVRYKFTVLGVFLLITGLVLRFYPALSEYEFVTQILYLFSVPLGVALLLPSISLIPAPNKNLYFLGKAVEKISLWSYSIYLAHIPVLYAAYDLLEAYRDNWVGNLFVKIIGLITTIFISSVVFEYFEKPILKLRPKNLTKYIHNNLTPISDTEKSVRGQTVE